VGVGWRASFLTLKSTLIFNRGLLREEKKKKKKGHRLGEWTGEGSIDISHGDVRHKEKVREKADFREPREGE